MTVHDWIADQNTDGTWVYYLPDWSTMAVVSDQQGHWWVVDITGDTTKQQGPFDDLDTAKTVYLLRG
jgi:hypothetical protein